MLQGGTAQKTFYRKCYFTKVRAINITAIITNKKNPHVLKKGI